MSAASLQGIVKPDGKEAVCDWAPRQATCWPYSHGRHIFHSGWEKWGGGEEQAKMLHGMAANAFPVVRTIEPRRFLKVLAGVEMTVGALLIAPIVPTAIAGTALSAFSGALVGMYFRTPELRKPGSIWPNQQGVGVSKDVWMLGMGTGYLLDSVAGSDEDAKKAA